MRLLPPQCEGLPEAYPASPLPQLQESSRVLAVLPVSGLLGLLAWPSTLIMRQRAMPVKVAAYSALGLSFLHIPLAISHDMTGRWILQSQGLSLPPWRFIERFGHFDHDDAALLGGIAGIIIASRLRKPWAVAGWRRALGFFCLGSTVGFMVKIVPDAFRMVTHPEEKARFDQQFDAWLKQRLQWQEKVRQEKLKQSKQSIKARLDASKARLDASKARLDACSTAPLKGLVPAVTDPFTMYAKGSWTGDIPQNLPGGSGASGRSGASESNLNSTNNVEPSVSEDGIHWTVRTKYDPEPRPMARTNYFWSSDRPIEDLEAHIGSLHARRQQLAREAEFLWARLSEKEAEFYNSPEATTSRPREAIDKPPKVVYIEHLAALHRKSWEAIVYCEWMIRDSQKRIEQVRSAQSNSDGKVTWRAEAEADTKPSHMLNILKEIEEGVSAKLAQLQQIYRTVAMGMATPEFDSSEEASAMVFSPFTNRTMTQREATMEIRNEVEKAVRVLQRDVDIAKAVIRDLESGGKESSKDKYR